MTSRAAAVWTLRWAGLFVLLGRAAAAQGGEPDGPRAGAVAVLATNVVVAGLTAAAHAAVARRDPTTAFARGAVGGAVHFAGKLIATRPGDGAGLAGVPARIRRRR